MDKWSILFGIFFTTLVICIGLFGYDMARSHIAEACLEKGMFIFQGTRYDCEIHTVP